MLTGSNPALSANIIFSFQKLKSLADGQAFIAALDGIITNELTNDFWRITLPAALDSSSARNPELFAYVAAQNGLSAPVLFSHKKVGELIDPALKTKKKALERHSIKTSWTST